MVYGTVAHLVEQEAFNFEVVGSNPTRPTKCECGEIGRHKGLKIPRNKLHVGSTPTIRTKDFVAV